MSEWISVKDRLPENLTLVLIWIRCADPVFTTGHVIAQHKDGVWDVEICSDEEVTYWMPLPPPPNKH